MTTNAHWWARREASVARGVGSVHQRFASKANNAELFDTEGNRLIDFATGIAVCNTGHSDSRIVGAVKDQLDRFSHACFQVTPYDSYIELAEQLNERAPGSSPKKSLFVTTGAEAVENAVKIARSYTGRRGVVAFKGGYHGRTMMTLALTGKVMPYQAGFGPMPGEVYHASFPYLYHGITEEMAWASLMDIFKADIEASATAAIIIEPVLGEGGFYVTPRSFMKRLRKFCDQEGILLIADEVQSGFARTGKLFAMDHMDVEPDLMTIAKAMAGGFPISGVIGKSEIMDAPGPGGLGGTYGGSPLGCVAGLEVLKIIDGDQLCDRANAIGEAIKSRLTTLQTEGVNSIGDIRGLGAMVAVELVKDGDPSQPDSDLTGKIVSESAKRGLMLLSCGIRGNVIRFLPALTASDAIVEEGLDILTDVIRKFSGSPGNTASVAAE